MAEVGIEPVLFVGHWLDFLILALATWRISSLLVCEEGPWEIFSKLRYAVGVRYDEHSNAYGKNVLAKMLTCIWCVTPWVAMFLVIFYAMKITVIILPFSLSAAAILVEEFVNGARQ